MPSILFEHLRSRALLGLVIIMPLAYWTPFHDCFPLTKWLALTVFGLLALGLNGSAGFHPAFRWVNVWVVWIVVELFNGISTTSFSRAGPEALLLVLPVLIAAGSVGITIARVSYLLIGVSLVIAAYGLFQGTGWDLGAWISPFHKGVASTIGNPDLLGGFLILPFALALAFAFDRPQRPGTVARWLAVAVLGGALVATEARAAWLGAATVWAVLVRGGNYRRFGLYSLGVVVGVALFLLWWRPATIESAMSTSALTERAWTWKIAARSMRAAPLAGTGTGSFRTEYLREQTLSRTRGENFYHYTEYAHMELLHIAVETGLIGLGLLLWGGVALTVMWWRVYPRIHGRAVWLGVGAGGLGLLVNSLLSFPFHVPPTVVSLLLLMGLGQRECGGIPVACPSAVVSLGRTIVIAVLLAVPFRLAYVSVALNDGQAFALAGLHNTALARLKAGMRLVPGEVRLPWYAAASARAIGNGDAALALIARGVALEPDFSELEYLRGMILNDAGRQREAEAAYRRAILIQPGDALVWNNLGNIMGREGRFEEAERAQRRALELNPRLEEARQNLAITLMLLKRSSAARHVLDGGDP